MTTAVTRANADTRAASRAAPAQERRADGGGIPQHGVHQDIRAQVATLAHRADDLARRERGGGDVERERLIMGRKIEVLDAAWPGDAGMRLDDLDAAERHRRVSARQSAIAAVDGKLKRFYRMVEDGLTGPGDILEDRITDPKLACDKARAALDRITRARTALARAIRL